MATNTFSAIVAGIGLRFTTTDAQGFAMGEETLQGFGAKGALPSDIVDIVVEHGTETSRPADATASFVADSHGQDTPVPFRWALDIRPDGETITVTYDERTTPFRRVQAVIESANKVRIVTDSYDTTHGVCAYVFPIFNLVLSRLLLRRDAFLIHCSVVRDDANGFLFTAPSGTGKSTMARIWQSCGATIVNDDMIAIRTSADGDVVAHNIPMAYYAQEPRSTKLSAICLISQSPTNVMHELRGALALAHVASNVIQQPATQESVRGIMSAVNTCTGNVRVFTLGFKPDSDVVSLVRDAFTSAR